MRNKNDFSKVFLLTDFANLPLGTTLYKATDSNIKWWYYAGINPKSPNSIMLITAGNVNQLEGKYISKEGIEHEPFYLKYDEVKLVLLENALHNVEKVKEIYLKDIRYTNNQIA